jgi:hypothetical protein
MIERNTQDEFICKTNENEDNEGRILIKGDSARGQNSKRR